MVTMEAEAVVTSDGNMTLPVPSGLFLGRPVFVEEDLRDIASEMPTEDEWAREHGVL